MARWWPREHRKCADGATCEPPEAQTASGCPRSAAQLRPGLTRAARSYQHSRTLPPEKMDGFSA